MNRVEKERLYWESEAVNGDIDRNVCDPGLEVVCIENIHIPKEGSVLEIGCGVGRLLRLFPEVNGLEYWGIDISKRMVKECSRRLIDRKDVKIVCNSGRDIPFQDDRFDYIYSVAVFQHIDDVGLIDYFNEVNRVLNKDGKFRFQFVVGEEKTEFSWQRSWREISEMLGSCMLYPIEVGEGIGYPNWGWITAVKII